MFLVFQFYGAVNPCTPLAAVEIAASSAVSCAKGNEEYYSLADLLLCGEVCHGIASF